MKRLIRIILPLFLLFIAIGCEEDLAPMNVGDPRIVVYNLAFPENGEPYEVTYYVRMFGQFEYDIPVHICTRDGSALRDADYEAIEDGELVFEPGESIKSFSITINGDRDIEEDETFRIVFSSPLGDFDEAEATIRIKDDDTGFDEGQLIIPSSGYTTPETYTGMELVWQDEFDQSELDATSWTHESGTGCPFLCGWGNAELQFYQPDNLLMVEDDYMVIQARREQVGGNDYTSSRIKTKDKREFQYGRVDIRAALPEGQGIWPALWMLGSNIDTDPWPSCGEIDIMEIIGSEPGRLHGTVHYGPDWQNRQYSGGTETLPQDRKFSEQFHVFSIVWEEDRITFLLDDVEYHTFTRAMAGIFSYPFNQPFYFIFNVAVGGNWPGSPDASTNFPQHLIVDYIRVFQEI